MPLTQEQIDAIPDEATRKQVQEMQQQQEQQGTGTGPYAAGHRPEPHGTTAEPGEHPADTQIERRGTTSPGGTYRVGNIEIPLGPPPGVASNEDVKQRIQDKAEDIRDMLGDADDAEAKVIIDKLNSGNYDENDLAMMSAHLNEEHVKKNREELSAKSEERRVERQERQQKRQQEQEQRQKERQEQRDQRRQERDARRGQEQPAEGTPEQQPAAAETERSRRAREQPTT